MYKPIFSWWRSDKDPILMCRMLISWWRSDKHLFLMCMVSSVYDLDLIFIRPYCVWGLSYVSSSIASPICQEGQNERTFAIFAFSSWFFLFFPIFSLHFPIFGKFLAVKGGNLPPLTPQWLCHCVSHWHRFVFYAWTIPIRLSTLKCSWWD